MPRKATGSVRYYQGRGWKASVTFPLNESGQRLQEQRWFGENEAEAQLWKATKLLEIQQGVAKKPVTNTVESYLSIWHAGRVKRRQIKGSTAEAYEIDIRLHINPTLGKIKLQRLERQNVQKMIDHLIDKGLSARSIVKTVAVLRKALNDAIVQNYIKENPATLLSMPRVDPPEYVIISANDYREFFQQVRKVHPAYQVAISLAVLGGLRLGEALGLQWQHVLFNEVSLAIEQQLDKNGRRNVELRDPKTRKSTRFVPMGPDLADILLKEYQRQEHLKRDSSFQDFGLVCCNNDGTPLARSTLHKWWTVWTQGTEYDSMRYHDLRHSFLSALVAAGEDLASITSLAGHAKLSTLTDVYTHASKDRMKELPERMRRIFNVSEET